MSSKKMFVIEPEGWREVPEISFDKHVCRQDIPSRPEFFGFQFFGNEHSFPLHHGECEEFLKGDEE